MACNDLLLALTVLERSKPFLNEDKRAQITKASMRNIEQCLVQSLQRLTAYDTPGNILVALNNALITIQSVIDDNDILASDDEMKEFLIRQIEDGLSALYLFVGEYYFKNEFKYDRRLGETLNRLVDKCIERGFYFDVDKDLRKGC